MTGFAGVVRFDDAAVWDATAERLATALDGAMPGRTHSLRRSRYLFTHRQAVILPEDRYDQQPHRADGLALCFDGRIDNREELAKRLSLSFDLAKTPDSLLVHAAVQRWGVEAAEKMRGDFAFAVWDERQRQLILGCDIFAQRPLFFYRGAGFVVFASTLRAAVAIPQVPRELNEAVLADFLADIFSPPEQTFYREVWRVAPASVMTFTEQGERQTIYWQPDPERRVRFSSDSEYVEAARELLDRSVSARLRAADPVVAALTGGLDSASVATSAARCCAPQQLNTVTVLPESDANLVAKPGHYLDERPLVEAIAAMYPNMVPHFVVAEGRPLIWTNPQAYFDITGEPVRGVLNMGWLAAATDQVRALGSRVLLVGDFGNPTWSWDGVPSLSTMLKTGHWWRLLREARALAAGSGGARWSRRTAGRLLWHEAVRPFLPAEVRRGLLHRRQKAEAPWQCFSAMRLEFGREQGVLERMLKLGGGQRDSGGGAWRQRIQSFPASGAPHYRSALLRGLRGVETRDPFTDRNLLEFLLAIPEDQYLRDGQTRHLARRALVGRAPERVIENRLADMQCPEWFNRMQRERPYLEMEIRRLEALPLAQRCLDLPRLRALIADWPPDSQAMAARGAEYRAVLARGIHFGQYVNWFEGGNG
ncbi:asparagine synthase-related protein [Methylomonas methanica]|uniref:asparagine synthase (glutamine-hydrolyzing) n=1 Tax=Methylomonas methanica (strain DSM 25384 / MC09) TaxID=857087 RepID=F9ZW56_METMM|nr:asparagine synthase-related protein [Methylomonas methanica]AEG02027.1 asparagine synthase [Methylomonas methanica MC09]